MKKIDLKKELKHLYRPTGKAVSIVDVPAMNFLMIDGEGDPNARKSLAEDRKDEKNPPALPLLRFDSFDEGPSAQILHTGPYDAEGPTIERLHGFIAENGGERTGRRHEIYLNDARRTAPEKLNTVLWQPFKG